MLPWYLSAVISAAAFYPASIVVSFVGSSLIQVPENSGLLGLIYFGLFFLLDLATAAALVSFLAILLARDRKSRAVAGTWVLVVGTEALLSVLRAFIGL